MKRLDMLIPDDLADAVAGALRETEAIAHRRALDAKRVARSPDATQRDHDWMVRCARLEQVLHYGWQITDA